MPKEPKCKSCGETFVRYNTIQRLCVKCAIEKVKQDKSKAHRKETREARQRLKTRNDHLKEAQAVCNAYIRYRDRHKGCVSCDKPASWGGQWHASHLRPQGNCSPLRFHEMNIHKACSECNNHKSGNLLFYRASLVKMIGAEYVEWLESQNHPYTWEIDDIQDVKQYYKDKLKELRKQAL